MTEAVSAKGVQLGIDLEGSGSYTFFAEVKSVPEIGESADKIDATHLTSEIKESVKDIPDYSSDISFTMNAIPAGLSDSNYDIIQSMDKDETYTWMIIYPQLNVQVTFRGQWTWSMGAGEVSSIQEITLNVIPSSAPVWATYDATATVSYEA